MFKLYLIDVYLLITILHLIFGSVLFSKSFGYEEDSKPLYFNKEKIKQSTQTINYLYGQLLDVHKKNSRLSPRSALLTYSGKTWTTDSAALMNLLYLGNAANIIAPFEADKNNTAYLGDVTPTLSPKDCKFSEWFKSYEAKMKKLQDAGFEIVF